MNNLFYITVFGLLSGIIGTGGGGLAALLIKKVNDNLLAILLGFSAGIMTVIVFIDLIPEAQNTGNMGTALMGIFLGVVLIASLDIIFPHQHFSFTRDMNERDSRFIKTGILLSIGIALHNIPEGLAIGASYQVAWERGFRMAILIALHNLPEGMAVATALALAKIKSSKILLITILTGVPTGIGAFIGGYLGGVSDFVLSISLGLAAGAMMYVVYDELIPDAHAKAKGHSAIIGIITGIFLGIIFVEVLH